MSKNIPLSEEKSGLFNRVQREQETIRKTVLAEKVRVWLSQAQKVPALNEAASHVTTGLEKGSILWCIKDFLPEKDLQIEVQGGKWRVWYMANPNIFHDGTAVVINVTHAFDPKDLSPEASGKILHQALKADKHAGDPSSPNRIVAKTLDLYRFLNAKVQPFPANAVANGNLPL